jgi:hypothetical protein
VGIPLVLVLNVMETAYAADGADYFVRHRAINGHLARKY